MQDRVLSVLGLLLISISVQASPTSECQNLKESIRNFSNPDKDFELRSRLGTCLILSHIGKDDVARAALNLLRDQGEDLLLKEDIIAALADSPIRRKIKREGKLAPALGKQEREAVDRALSSVGGILEAAQAVKTIEETVPVTPLEADFFRVLSDIALDEVNHVLLRASAVSALERLSMRVVQSGVYEEKSLRLVHQTLRYLASREDNISYFTEANLAYNRLAVAGIPGYSRDIPGATRMISSLKSLPEK